ncbi:MAG: flavodoxin family protein [Lachnospiraceae bacterium]|nr:flavodoxin family protein [Lachnospiraceae bacterium]
MKAIAINGSPRRNKNTATLLDAALKGAASKGADEEMIHLYDLQYKGCNSCFACKRKEHTGNGCAMRDELSEVLAKVENADVLILGSPIYYMNITSGMTAFLERLIFPTMIYSREIPTVFSHKLPTGLIYTMNLQQERMEQFGIMNNLKPYQNSIGTAFAVEPEILYSCNTYQFSDYSKYESSMFSEENKRKYREEQFPKDMEAAYQMGIKLIQQIGGGLHEK